ncbi:MAG: hypothetical protein QM667_02725 [Asticcacaulis sp.]
MMRSLVTFAALVFSLIGLSAVPAVAQPSSYSNGYNAARVEALTRPCFGVLLDYQLRTCAKQRRYYLPPYHVGRSTLTINCDTARQAYVEDMIRRMRSGGTVTMVARKRSCVASLSLSKSLNIIGDNGGTRLPVLVAPDGEACLRINPGADRVVLKNMLIESRRGGGSACIYSSGSELRLISSTVRYEGDAAALDVSGGRLDMRSSFVIAKTRTVAVDVKLARVYADQVGITSTSSGIQAVLNGDSQLQGLSVQQLADWRGFERGKGAVGMDIRLDSGDSILSMDDLRVEFFADAINISGGGEALLSRSLIDFADHGITSKLHRLRLIDNKIMASEIAVNVDDGEAFLGRNHIAKVRTAGILASPQGLIRAVDNLIDASKEDCQRLQWGSVEPALRSCTPWYKGSEFDIPADATRQAMYADYWPHLTAVTN